VCGHIGWPWTEEMIAVAWKHKNVWIDTSEHVPKHYPAEFVHFMKSFGKDKVCYATDYPLLQWERVLREVDALGLAPEIRQRFLHDNAMKAFKLPEQLAGMLVEKLPNCLRHRVADPTRLSSILGGV